MHNVIKHGISPRINLLEPQFEIITAAGKIITQSGISGLTIANVAKEMQYSESAICQYYLTREDIVVAMLDYLAFDMDMRFTNATEGTQDTEEIFLKLFREQATFFIENPYFMTVIFSDGLMEECERINNRISKIMESEMRHLLPVLVSGQENGYFRNDLSAEEMALIIIGAFRLLMYKWRLSNFQFNLKHRNELTIESILTLIKS